MNMKTYVFDIDGTICSLTSDSTYNDVIPFEDRIRQINALADAGNEVIFYTARGMGRTSNDLNAAKELFYDLTVNQLHRWNVRYKQLFFGKPAGDYYIDDKATRDYIFFRDQKSP